MYLRNFLQKYFPSTPKFLVLQGCHTGGFIREKTQPFKDQVLSTLDNLTVITASRYDRNSFGCEAADLTTYFGGTFNKLFKAHLSDPRNMNWKKLYLEVRKQIHELEKRLEGETLPSEPDFFSNFKKKQNQNPKIVPLPRGPREDPTPISDISPP